MSLSQQLSFYTSVNSFSSSSHEERSPLNPFHAAQPPCRPCRPSLCQRGAESLSALPPAAAGRHLCGCNPKLLPGSHQSPVLGCTPWSGPPAVLSSWWSWWRRRPHAPRPGSRRPSTSTQAPSVASMPTAARKTASAVGERAISSKSVSVSSRPGVVRRGNSEFRPR